MPTGFWSFYPSLSYLNEDMHATEDNIKGWKGERNQLRLVITLGCKQHQLYTPSQCGVGKAVRKL